MKLRLLISISLLALMTQKAPGQSADEFFHTGAQAYLTNNTTIAKEQVDRGLKLYPDDIKLKKLDDLLKQQQQKQSQQNQSQSKQDQQKQQQKPDEQKKQDQQKQQQQKGGQDKQDEKQQPKEDQNPGQMTPEEAKRLLDGQKGDEKLLPANQKDKQEREHPLKDW